MLVGVLLVRAAVPSLDTDKVKSLASKAPLAPLVLYTLSEKVTEIVELSDATDTLVIVGAVTSPPVII